MKRSIFIVFIIFFMIAVSFYLFFDTAEMFSENSSGWKYKEKETRSRLLSIPILLYHNIDGKGPFSIEYDTLRDHFQLINDNNIQVIPLKVLIQRLEKPAPFKKKTVVLTFDDGYLTMYTKLLPLVKEFGYPVTLFVYTDFIYTRSKKGMTWKILKELDAKGIDIQCHSISHDDLTLYSLKNDTISRKKLFDELYLSKRIVELYLGKEVDYFAFPYGRYDLNLIEMARYSGYSRVYSTDYGSNIISRDNYTLRRQHIKKEYTLDFFKSLIQ